MTSRHAGIDPRQEGGGANFSVMTEVGSRKKINSVKHLFEELVALRLMSTLGDFKHLGAKGGGD